MAKDMAGDGAQALRGRGAVYAWARRRVPVNVDFFSAVVYDALGIPPDFCTSIFATARVAGWCAHALEQYADNRLIRPRAHYVGPPPRPLVR
jgi:citrate synthase